MRYPDLGSKRLDRVAGIVTVALLLLAVSRPAAAATVIAELAAPAVENQPDLHLVLRRAEPCPGLKLLGESPLAIIAEAVPGSAVPQELFVARSVRVSSGILVGSGSFTFEDVILDNATYDGEDVRAFQVRVEPRSSPQVSCFLNPPQPLLAGPPTVVEVAGDEPPPEISIEDAVANEGDGQMSFRLSLTGPPTAQPVTVRYATRDGSARAGSDYQATSGELPLNPGVAELPIPLIGDGVQEPTETFFVELSSPVNARIVRGTAEGRIRDDDDGQEGESEVELSPGRQLEGDSGTSRMEFILALRSPSPVPMTVAWATVEETAREGEDYEPARDTRTFAAGATETDPIQILIIGDEVPEGDETFRVRLTDPQTGELRGEAIGTILEDDGGSVEMEPVGGTELTVLPGSTQQLAVRVTGAPQALEGVRVSWTVLAGVASLTVVGTEATEQAIVSTVSVAVGSDSGEVRIAANAGGAAVGFHLRVRRAPAPDPPPPGDVLDEICPDSELPPGLQAVCDVVDQTPDGELPEVLKQLAPEEKIAQADLLHAAQTVQLGLLGSRLAALRGGATRSAVEQLALRLDGLTLPVEALRSALLPEQTEDPGWEASALEAVWDEARAAGGGSASGPAADDSSARGQTPAGGGRLARFDWFLAGSLSVGERPRTAEESGFELSSQGLAFGVDAPIYGPFSRLPAPESEETTGVETQPTSLFVGAALGWYRTEAELEENGGNLTSDGFVLSTYAVLFKPVGKHHSFHLDLVLSRGFHDLSMERAVDLPRLGRRVAFGRTSGDQLSWSLGGGYERALGTGARSIVNEGQHELRSYGSLRGFASVSAVAADIDGYGETGASGADLEVLPQEVESQLVTLGVEWSRPVSLWWGILYAQAGLSALHELEDDRRRIRARFREDPRGLLFSVPTSEPDRNYLNLNVGLSALFPIPKKARGILPEGLGELAKGFQTATAYLQLETDLDRDDLTSTHLSFGIRTSF